MKRDEVIPRFLDSYQRIKNLKLNGRYLHYARLKPEIGSLPNIFKVQEEGTSVLGTPIDSINFGDGSIKIMGWSQMHGNESTTTRALFDLFNYLYINKDLPEVKSILQQCSFKIIPMLNPDGAQKYSRENANGVDLNRDAEMLTQQESRVLRSVFDEYQPNYCFNLHDQRTIFGAGSNGKPATLSFLAPAFDEERNISLPRKKAMQIIADINQRLQEFLPGQVGKFDDAFNINCTGDRFMAFDVPTILFEAGHHQEDYRREITRKYMAAAILSAMDSIADGSHTKQAIKDYNEIPGNLKVFYDIVLRKAAINEELVDVAIQYHEKLSEGEIIFEPRIQIIDKDLNFFGHREITCEGQEVRHTGGERLVENDVVDGILLNRDNFSLKIE